MGGGEPNVCSCGFQFQYAIDWYHGFFVCYSFTLACTIHIAPQWRVTARLIWFGSLLKWKTHTKLSRFNALNVTIVYRLTVTWTKINSVTWIASISMVRCCSMKWNQCLPQMLHTHTHAGNRDRERFFGCGEISDWTARHRSPVTKHNNIKMRNWMGFALSFIFQTVTYAFERKCWTWSTR